MSDRAAISPADSGPSAVDLLDAASRNAARAASLLATRRLRSAIAEGRMTYEPMVPAALSPAADLQFARRCLQSAFDDLDHAMRLAHVDPWPGFTVSDGE